MLAVTATVAVTVSAGAVFYAQSQADLAARQEAAAAAEAAQYQRQVRAAAEEEAAEAARREEERISGLLDTSWPEDGPLTVALYGDSISAGQHSVSEASAFRSLLLGSLETRGEVNFIGRYFAGARIGDMAEKFSPYSDVDLILMQLGLNDAFKETPTGEFAISYRAYLASLKAASPDASVLCLGVWGMNDAQNRPYNEQIGAVCSEFGGKYIDLSTTFADMSTHGPAGNVYWQGETDEGHPNDEGHARIADLIAARLPQLIPLEG
ncbi:SGNH/GDSL hydrolase family protein [Microbacterium sp. SMR1]|uniref:SGNH/GDSL hydrolase family protein n=1 Tax=Microbacterium sp. SMR1 TaxID=1497340 RepID=UPI0015ECAC84|nr:SGNH/GDSL hydrolase family protein [Microbacterium sp. SMR1]